MIIYSSHNKISLRNISKIIFAYTYKKNYVNLNSIIRDNVIWKINDHDTIAYKKQT